MKNLLLHAKTWILLSLALAIGCENNGLNNIKEKQNIVSAVFGRVTDRTGQALAGVTVHLMGDKAYQATTDALGYYRIEEVFVAHSLALIGSGGAGGAIAQSEDTLEYPIATAYTILFTYEAKEGMPGLATFRDQVTLQAHIYRTGNSYMVETSPVSYDAVLVPYADFRVQVVTGEVTQNGEPVPAAGANVEVWPIRGDALLFETVAAQTSADGGGFAHFNEAFKIAAVSGYRIIVFPYDVDPEENNGCEYDTGWKDIDLSAYSELVLNANGWQAGVNDNGDEVLDNGDQLLNDANDLYECCDILINLKDHLATNAPPRVAFSHPEEEGEIKPNSPIRLFFSRSMDPTSIEYKFQGCLGECVRIDPTIPEPPPPNGLTLLTQELERSQHGISFMTIDDLSRLFEEFDLEVTAKTPDGIELTTHLYFKLSKELLPEGATAPLPSLHLPQADGSTSQYYASAIDFASLYVFDAAMFDEESYRGTLYTSTDNTLDPTRVKPTVDHSLPIRWRPIEEAQGYRIFARNDHAMNNWVQLAELGPTALSLQDNGFVVAEIDLSNPLFYGFDRYGDDDVLTPFCCGTTMMIAVLPFYGEDQMPPINPNAILTLSDNYGAAIMPEIQGVNLDGLTTLFAGKLYDELVTIAFSEYMNHALTPEILEQPGDTTGVAKVSGRFEMEWVDWMQTTHYTGWHLQLASLLNADLQDLFIGDHIRLTDGEETCSITGLDFCTAENPLIYCDGTLFEGTTIELLGPIGPAGDPLRELAATTTGATPVRFVVDEIPTDVTFSMNHKWMLEQGSTKVLVSVTEIDHPADAAPADADPMRDIVTIEETNGYDDIIAAVEEDFVFDGTTLFNNSPERQLSRPIESGNNGDADTVDIYLDSVQGLAPNDVITLIDNDYTEQVKIDVVNHNETSVKVPEHDFTHAQGTKVALYPYAHLAKNAVQNDEEIILANPNGVPFQFTEGDIIQIGNDTNPGGDGEIARVKEVSGGNTLKVDIDPSDDATSNLALDHPAGSVVRLVQSDLVVRSTPISFENTTGMQPGMTLTLNSENEVFNYNVCAIIDNDLYLDRTHGLHNVNAGYVVVPLDENHLKPEDRIIVVAQDAALNNMRSNADELVGDGEVELSLMEQN